VEAKLKWLILEKKGFDLALIPAVQQPSGDEEILFGETAPVYALSLATSGEVSSLGAKKDRSPWGWAVNLGYYQRAKDTFKDQRSEPVPVTSYSQLQASSGYQVTRSIELGAQYFFRYQSQSTFGMNPQNPSEAGFYGRYQLSSWLHLSSGLNLGMGPGIGAPAHRVWAGVSAYH
jgi:hypothetical protein